MREIQNID